MKPWEKYSVESGPWSKYSSSIEQPTSSGVTRSFDVEPSAPEGTPSFSEAAAPRQARIWRGGEGNEAAATVGDVLSFVGRAVRAALRTGTRKIEDIDLDEESKKTFRDKFGEEWDIFKTELAKTESDAGGVVGFAENVLVDPATTATLPIGGVGGKGAQAAAGGALKQVAKAVGRGALTGAAEGAVSAGVHQLENAGAGRKVNAGQAAGEVALSAGLGGLVAGGAELLKKLTGKGAKEATRGVLSNFTQVPEDVLDRVTTPGELEKIRKAMVATGGDLEKLSDDVIRMVDDIKIKAQGEFESGVMAARPGGVLPKEEVTGYTAGERIADVAETAKRRVGERFGQLEDITLEQSGAAKRRLPGVGGEADVALQNQTGNILQDKVDEVFAEVGHDPVKGFTGLERIDNKAVSKPAVDALRKAKEMFGNASNTSDALNMRRQIQKDIAFGGPDGRPLFKAGSDEDRVMKKLYLKINEVIEDQIRAQGADAGIGDDLVQLWKKNNEVWKSSSDVLRSVDKTSGFKTGKSENYFRKVKDIGINRLRQISDIASRDPEIAPVWKELQDGFYDNVIARSMKEGSIDIPTFRKNWGAIDKNLKETMLAPEAIKQVDDALKNVRKYGYEKVSDIGKQVTGSSKQATLKNVENIGSKERRVALAELKFLEDIAGVDDANRFSTLAEDAYAGKELGILKGGRLPGLSNIRTGKFLAGGAAGGATGATIGGKVAGPVGAAIGGPLGFIIGAYSQSPAGAVALYRAADKAFKLAAKKPLRAAGKATFAAAGKPTRTAIRSNLFGYETDEE